MVEDFFQIPPSPTYGFYLESEAFTFISWRRNFAATRRFYVSNNEIAGSYVAPLKT